MIGLQRAGKWAEIAAGGESPEHNITRKSGERRYLTYGSGPAENVQSADAGFDFEERFLREERSVKEWSKEAKWHAEASDVGSR